MKSRWILLILSLILGSCKDRLLVDRVEKVRTVVFNIGFNYYPNDSGCFFNSDDDLSFYFCDQTTEKELKFFNKNGKLTDSVSLIKGINIIGDDAVTISVISKDTIVLCSFYKNEIVAINSHGEIWLHLEIEKILPEGLKNNYEFWSNSHTSFDRNDISYFLRAWPDYNNVMKKNSAENMGFADKTVVYSKELFITPYFLNITNYLSSSPTVNMGLTDLYSHICTEDCLFSEIPYYRFINNKIIFFSEYSDKLFIIDPDELRIDGQIKIKSKYTPIGGAATIINKETVYKQRQQQNDIRTSKGRISNVFYDKNTENYLLIITHKKYDNKFFKTNAYLKFFSIIILNNRFEFVDEVLFDSGKYNTYSGIMTNEGLALEEINLENSQKGEKSYAIFKIN